MTAGRRVVFDTSSLVSAALRSSSSAERAVLLALRSGVICIAPSSLRRLQAVLGNAGFNRFMAKRRRMAFVDLLGRIAWLCPDSQPEMPAARRRSRERRTNALLAFAASAEADVVVSSDRALLARKSLRRIPIFTPDEFIARYDST